MDTGWQDARKAVVLAGHLNYKNASFGKCTCFWTLVGTEAKRRAEEDRDILKIHSAPPCV